MLLIFQEKSNTENVSFLLIIDYLLKIIYLNSYITKNPWSLIQSPAALEFLNFNVKNYFQKLIWKMFNKMCLFCEAFTEYK